LSGRTECVFVRAGKNPAYNGRTIIPGHIDAFRVMTEIVEVQSELAVVFGSDYVAKDFYEPRLAIRRKAHDFAFVAVVGKPEELSRRSVQYSSRVRVLHLAENIYRIRFANGPHCRDEIAKTIDREQGGTCERRDEETARKMGTMMLDIVKLRADRAS
jgi:hypothetical protein